MITEPGASRSSESTNEDICVHKLSTFRGIREVSHLENQSRESILLTRLCCSSYSYFEHTKSIILNMYSCFFRHIYMLFWFLGYSVFTVREMIAMQRKHAKECVCCGDNDKHGMTNARKRVSVYARWSKSCLHKQEIHINRAPNKW